MQKIKNRKLLAKFNTYLWIKRTLESRIDGNYLNMIKAMCDKPRANIILSDEKVESISPKIRNRTRMSFVQHSFGSPSHRNHRRKKKKKKESKLEKKWPENDQIASKNLVKLPDAKLIHRNTLLCTNNERSEGEIKETIPFTITAKSIKYLRKNLLKETKNLYSEKYETLMKDIKDDTDGKLHPGPGLEKSILSKWLHYPSQWYFFAELKQKVF